MHLSELPRIDERLEAVDARVVFEQVPDHQHAAVLASHAHGLLRLRGRLGQRLLHQYMLSRFEAAAGQVGVRGHRRGDDHGLEGVVLEQLVDRAGCPCIRKTSAGGLEPLGRVVADPGQARPGQGVHVAGEIRAPVAEPRHGHRHISAHGREANSLQGGPKRPEPPVPFAA